MSEIYSLLKIMKHLRDPDNGCPWDLKQNFASIAPYTIEEAYEVADAIEREDMADLREELGDLLFQVVFHAQMAQEAGHFAFEDVVNSICGKMERRHPHVFGDTTIENADQQTEAWETFKAEERQNKQADARASSALDGVSIKLPALTRATKLQKRAARVGFDWPEIAPVLDKIHEELEEVKRELPVRGDHSALELEIGDLLFAVANLARHAHVDPEVALRKSNAKFDRRFRAIEKTLQDKGIALEDAGLAVMEDIYQQIKQDEKKRND